MMGRRRAFVHGGLMLVAGVAAGYAAEGGTGGQVWLVLLFLVLAYSLFVE